MKHPSDIDEELEELIEDLLFDEAREYVRLTHEASEQKRWNFHIDACEDECLQIQHEGICESFYG